MMRSIHKVLIPFLFILLLIQTSCSKDFLEIEPKGSRVAKTTSDYEQLMNAVSLQVLYAASLYQGDEMAAQQTYMDAASIRTQRLFRFEERVYDDDQLPSETWHLGSIYTFNKVINEVMQSQGGTDQQKKAILAEAKVGRALCHLYFLSDYSLPYNAATAATDLGVPLLTKADVTQTTFVRASVQESYDFIIKDLVEALPDLGPLTHRRKFSRIAAEFILGRVYLYMAKFDEASTHVDAAFAELDKATIPLALYDYNTVLDPNEIDSWLPDFGFGLSNYPLAANNAEVMYNLSMINFQLQQANTYVFSPETAALYDPMDKRLLLFSGNEMFNPDQVFPRGMRRYSASLFSGLEVGPSLPDLYLMRAELKARAGNLTGAKSDLEFLRSKRMPANIVAIPSSIAGDKEALVRFILDERIREFATSGMRWMDMRRLSVDPVYGNTVKYTHKLYDDAGNVVAIYTLKPERFALKFGQRMLAENKGLIENK
ncbi:RagB/SusD family nutrient uptake outer membrane protein [Chitinophaga sp. 22321]|uniref:RagB/SusD family nutrient uptake outer membrane protein n=1 Tax=Chitinophaga hostae TaxID=2831022 RepID=A0ABS5J576_9BACT|nr:RagB/SusD family nutrient uptake outer membrane protein [Chitinophaga hostae]MBS0030216.1 RagB/SusD family nutrient uptake outer membrane protein [Chitinophaga hostae]